MSMPRPAPAVFTRCVFLARLASLFNTRRLKGLLRAICWRILWSGGASYDGMSFDLRCRFVCRTKEGSGFWFSNSSVAAVGGDRDRLRGMWGARSSDIISILLLRHILVSMNNDMKKVVMTDPSSCIGSWLSSSPSSAFIWMSTRSSNAPASAAPNKPSRVNGWENPDTICACPTFSAPGATVVFPPSLTWHYEIREKFEQWYNVLIDGIDDGCTVGGIV